eukprot:TRINITY_DN3209_c1_g2_i2.p1 TRINITY_DN3209_c1_g2~~TRINITY_DN3209_c1_g2_i2.p1  ORF type:complete len:1008 (+),score=255.37 TRINITY_DN3209_c1_g2_i2:392-3025(+)
MSCVGITKYLFEKEATMEHIILGIKYESASQNNSYVDPLLLYNSEEPLLHATVSPDSKILYTFNKFNIKSYDLQSFKMINKLKHSFDDNDLVDLTIHCSGKGDYLLVCHNDNATIFLCSTLERITDLDVGLENMFAVMDDEYCHFFDLEGKVKTFFLDGFGLKHEKNLDFWFEHVKMFNNKFLIVFNDETFKIFDKETLNNIPVEFVHDCYDGTSIIDIWCFENRFVIIYTDFLMLLYEYVDNHVKLFSDGIVREVIDKQYLNLNGIFINKDQFLILEAHGNSIFIDFSQNLQLHLLPLAYTLSEISITKDGLVVLLSSMCGPIRVCEISEFFGLWFNFDKIFEVNKLNKFVNVSDFVKMFNVNCFNCKKIFDHIFDQKQFEYALSIDFGPSYNMAMIMVHIMDYCFSEEFVLTSFFDNFSNLMKRLNAGQCSRLVFDNDSTMDTEISLPNISCSLFDLIIKENSYFIRFCDEDFNLWKEYERLPPHTLIHEYDDVVSKIYFINNDNYCCYFDNKQVFHIIDYINGWKIVKQIEFDKIKDFSYKTVKEIKTLPNKDENEIWFLLSDEMFCVDWKQESIVSSLLYDDILTDIEIEEDIKSGKWTDRKITEDCSKVILIRNFVNLLIFNIIEQKIEYIFQKNVANIIFFSETINENEYVASGMNTYIFNTVTNETIMLPTPEMNLQWLDNEKRYLTLFGVMSSFFYIYDMISKTFILCRSFDLLEWNQFICVNSNLYAIEFVKGDENDEDEDDDANINNDTFVSIKEFKSLEESSFVEEHANMIDFNNAKDKTIVEKFLNYLIEKSTEETGIILNFKRLSWFQNDFIRKLLHNGLKINEEEFKYVYEFCWDLVDINESNGGNMVEFIDHDNSESDSGDD